MVFVAVIALSLALFAGFLLLTRYEARRGARFFAASRDALDAKIERAAFIATHVNFESFLRDTLRALAAYAAHDLAHFTLLLVRFAERLLTRAVRHLRVNHQIVAPAAPRPFVQAMSDFKRELASTRPSIPEV